MGIQNDHPSDKDTLNTPSEVGNVLAVAVGGVDWPV